MVPTIGLAFLAGLLSFISPCVLPLVPAYIGYMGGRVTHTVAAQQGAGATRSSAPSRTFANRFVTLLHGLSFVLGFTFIFVVLGLLTTAFVVQVGRQNVSLIEALISRVGGVLVIFFGLHFMGVMPSLFRRALASPRVIGSLFFSLGVAIIGSLLILWALVDVLIALPGIVIFLLWFLLGGAFTSPGAFWTRTITGVQTALYSDTRRQMTARGQQSFASSAVMGVVFAAGWTPCIGPVYGAVLTMAANGGDVSQAGTLLGAYSLGLGIPFLLTAVLLDSAQTALRRIQRHMHRIELVTGAFLIAMGVLIASGQLQRLSNTFAGQFTDVSVTVESCVLGFANGEIPFDQVGPCLNGQQVVGNAPVNPGFEFIDEPPPTSTPQGASAALNTITGLAQASLGSATTPGIEVGNQALNITTVSDSGQPIALNSLRGKVVFVNFWATWCGPCRKEMPEFERAVSQDPDGKLAVIAINNRESGDEIAAFRRDVRISFPIGMDENGQIQALYGIGEYPTTLVIDPNGIIIRRHVGPMTAGEIENLVHLSLS